MNMLLSALDKWDGKSADYLMTVYVQFSEKNNFLCSLIDVIVLTRYQKGSTWLINHWLSNGGKLSRLGTENLIDSLVLLEEWESKLHVLQSFQYLLFPDSKKTELESFILTSLSEKNRFVRAWAYNSYHLLSKRFPEYRDDAIKALEIGLRDESASVKARIRNVLKK